MGTPLFVLPIVMSMNKYTRTDKYIYRSSSTVVVILALAAGILSYSSLQRLAVMSGINPILAYLFPIVLDGLILSGTLLVLYFAIRGKRSAFGIFLTLLGVVASICGNIAVSDNNLIHQMVHGAPALVLFLALEALTILLRARYQEEKAAEEGENASPQKEPSHTSPEPQPRPYEESSVESTPRPQEVSQLAYEAPQPAYTAPADEQPTHVLSEPVEVPQTAQNDVPEESFTAPSFSEPRASQDYMWDNDVYNVDPYDTTLNEDDEPEPVEEPQSVPERPVERPTEPAQSNPAPEPHSPVQAASVTDELMKLDSDDVPGESKREKMQWIVQRDPEIRPKDVNVILGGDASYNRKLLREVKKSASVG